MRTIMCFGDSNVRGVCPGPSLDSTGSILPRFSKHLRWTGLLQKRLGNDWDVIEEGINGRTTSLDDTIRGRPFRNGLKELPFALEANYPIDLVLFLIGTNDLQNSFSRSVRQVGEGLRSLVRTVQTSAFGPELGAPKVLVVAPPKIIELPQLYSEFRNGAIEKSSKLAAEYAKVSREEGCAFLDASSLVQSSSIDGIHIDEETAPILAEAVWEKIEELFPIQ